MTEIVLRSDGVSLIQAAAQDMQAAHALATAICSTAFAPAHFKGKPDEGAAAMLYGQTIGMDPLTALQNIFMISGKPGLYARTQVAIAQAQGHEVWTEEDTPTKVVVCGRRKGLDKIERSEWTIERARVAGYTNNRKYETDPQAMLYARAAGDVTRKIAADALIGMAYNVEELQLDDAPDPGPAPRAGAARLGAALGLAPAPAAIEAPAEPTPEPSGRDWAAEAGQVDTVEAVRALWNECAGFKELTDDLRVVLTARVVELSPPITAELVAEAVSDAPDVDAPAQGDLGWPEVAAPAASRRGSKSA